ncbi:MAG: hypothetical protein BWY63_01015 [Chloroflexi bacterium ADurb.Bin360]|nr:MAG: hypothetical protein BWY63_01015 [Chloroflexi bacterium ADurb.Bin360]
MMAPTDKSTPPVAITNVMPIASKETVEALRTISIRLPYRLPSRVEILKKPGTAIKSKSRIAPRAIRGKKSLLSVIFRKLKENLNLLMLRSPPWIA